MKCERCSLRSATHVFVEITRDERKEMRVCESCAWTLAIALPKETSVKILPHKKTTPGGKENLDLVCPRCGRHYVDVKKNLLVGCSECYAAFLENLRAFLKKLHDEEVRYRGQIYTHDPHRRKLLERRQALLKQLEEMVTQERFEEAARIRDTVQQIEEELGWTSSNG